LTTITSLGCAEYEAWARSFNCTDLDIYLSKDLASVPKGARLDLRG